MMGSVAANIYRTLPDELLDHAIGKLERLVRSLERGGAATAIAADYRRSLDLARAERARRASV